MDTAAYLTSQGWRGNGHALHYSGRGITTPIHIVRKTNVLGVGKKQHDAYADQWWARAFNDTLKGLSTTKNEETGQTEGIAFSLGTQALQAKMVGGAKGSQGGLYSKFVRGESLSGTLVPDEINVRDTQLQPEVLRTREKASDEMGLSTIFAKDVKISQRKRRRQEADTAEYSKAVSLDVVQRDSRDVRPEGCRKSRMRPKYTETKGEQQQKRMEKKARKFLKVGKSHELPELPRATASKNIVTSVRPRRRSKVQKHTVENVKTEATSACNSLLDEERNDTS